MSFKQEMNFNLFEKTRKHVCVSVLHQSSQRLLIGRSLGQSNDGRRTSQRSRGQIQQRDDAVRHVAAAALHLPQLVPALAVSPPGTNEEEASDTTQHLKETLFFKNNSQKKPFLKKQDPKEPTLK